MKASLYEALHRGNPGDLQFYSELCAKSSSILELGCGYGRVLAALEKAGRELFGVDHDEGLLDIAHARVPEASLLCADIRDFNFDHKFDAVLIPYSTLFCFQSGEEVCEILKLAKKHLAKNGFIALDVWNPSSYWQSHTQSELEEELSFLVSFEIDGNQWGVFEAHKWIPNEQCVYARYQFQSQTSKVHESVIVHHYRSRAEMEALVSDAGLRPKVCYGDFDNSEWTKESKHTVLLCS